MAMAGLYRRPLPSPPAIDFASAEGKQIFKEALQKGNMEGFFRLISYFQTQSEPSYCGLASLSMVMNALSIDPGRKWKGPWRWFDESMLDCCEPLEIVKDKGIAFGKVVCLAHCSGAKVEAFRTSQSTIEDFRKCVIKCSSSDNCHIITSYHRGVFKQTGTGHFSPIGGYNAERDMALILDVARFKYPPHWVPLKLLWEAMDSLDLSTGQRRGFMLISRPHREPGLLYTLSCKDESWLSIAKYLTEDVPRLVSSQHVNNVEKILSVVFKSLPSNFNQFIRWVAELRRKEDLNQNLSAEEKSRLNLKQEVLKQVLESELFKHVSKFLSSVEYEDNLHHVAAKVCCQGAEVLLGNLSKELCCRETCVKCVKGTGEEAITVVSGIVLHDGSEQQVDLLVPSAQADPKCCDCGPESVYPAGNDVLTVLLMALPIQTWSGIKDQAVMYEMKQLVSMASLPTLLQEEVLHLRRQLQLLRRCQENKEEDDLAAPAF
ncbi:PREDICTED: glutathione gamma-glutamylcysteinyltransferase 1-like [Tarenaya hassleriana]|uniref:glutathione gamma-glutamylcysteinyltransferase 1-like n=1 Tax=Tarenaya hassleriana TaxID=28532 RepID=UPI00053C65E1|nr:PREDICTED: glutathione gamma-glutamylcysteinyltransferase 1-like [Tarenaya hassleriana]